MIGRWGQGKTHFWKDIARTHAPDEQAARANYAYVSLFGLNSLSDLRIELAQKLRRAENIDDDTFASILRERMYSLSWLRRAFRWVCQNTWLGEHLVRHGDAALPHMGKLGPIYRAWAFSQVKDSLICLDDLERRGSGLALKDVLGLTTHLVTERNCSVVVIFNERSLENEDKTIWKANKEKVFMGEVRYVATPEQCVNYIYASGTDNLSELECFTRAAILDLAVTNVRIIERIKHVCDQVSSALPPELHTRTYRKIARCIALYVYSVTGQGDGAPPPEELRTYGAARALKQMTGASVAEKPTQEQLNRQELLTRYRYRIHGVLDEALVDVVDKGYPNEERLCQAALEQDEVERRDDVDEEFREAWRLFHESLEDNSEEIVERLRKSFSRLSSTLSARNADTTIMLLRALGKTALADELMMLWIHDRANGERREELSNDRMQKFEAIEDPIFKDAANQAYERLLGANRPSLYDIMEKARTERFIQSKSKPVLASAEVADYVAYFRAHAADFPQVATMLLAMDEGDPSEEQIRIRDKTTQALIKLSEESAINHWRVKWKLGNLIDLPDHRAIKMTDSSDQTLD